METVSIRESILSSSDLKKERVETPEWKKAPYVFVTEMRADDRDEFDLFIFEMRSKLDPKKRQYPHIRAALAVATIINENGERIFSFDDVEAVGKLSGVVLDRIFDVSNRLNKVFGSERDNAEKKAEAPQGDLSDGE